MDAPPTRDNPWTGLLVLAGAVTVALLSARGYAGSWNDGSRLATVECLVDYHTLAIDRSVFVRVPPASPPYPASEPTLLRGGTADKLRIGGHFYSDKSPVPALLLAGVYQVCQWTTGLTARESPGWFCYLMTLASSGLAYVAAAWCVWRFGRPLGLAPSLRLALTASFALATVALPYAQHVNNHVLLLGVAAALMLGLAHLSAECGMRNAERKRNSAFRIPHSAFWLGTLAGFGYTIDLGTGPVLLVCTVALVAWRCRRVGAVAAVVAAALPWLALHHAINYAVGGTLGPANAVAAYFQWPGCPFTPENLTGGWKHPHVWHFLSYAVQLLAGKRGFLGHNPALLLALPVAFVLLWRRTPEWPEVLFACLWCSGTWLAYAFNSNNYSGACCSIRWFVPLLAPGYYLLAVFLREHPGFKGDFLVLSGCGAVLAGLMARTGPWLNQMVPGYWVVFVAALLGWAGYRVWRWRYAAIAVRALPDAERPAHAA